MSKIHLTNRFIKSIEPPATGQKFYWDADVTGFGVRATCPTTRNPLGDTSYVVQVSRGEPPYKRRTLCKCFKLSVEEARSQAAELLKALERGEDPRAEEVQREGKGITVEQAFKEYLENRELGELSRRDYAGLLRRNLAHWKDRAIGSITPKQCSDLHKTLTEGETGGTKKKPKVIKRGSRGQANYTLKVLGAVIEYVKAAYRDPSTGISVLPYNAVRESIGRNKIRAWNKMPRRRTLISGDDLATWYQAVLGLADNDRNTAPEVTRDYLLLMLFTGLRRGECSRIKRTDIDFKRKLLYIPAYATRSETDDAGVARTRTTENNKARRDLALPLTETHIAILRRRVEALAPKDEYIFPATGEKYPYITDPRKQFRQVTAKSGVTFTPHALRRTFVTTAEALGLSTYALKALVNHALGDGDVTAGYIVMQAERLRPDMELIVDKLLTECGAKRRARLKVVK